MMMMTTNSVRAGVNQARVTQTGASFVAGEFALLGIGMGMQFESWGLGVSLFLIGLGLLAAAARVAVVAWLLAGIMSLAWGALFFLMHPMVGLLAFLVSAGAHLAAIQYMRDA